MLTLAVPGLIWPRQALADLSFDLPLPAFFLLLGRGRLSASAAADADGLLAAEFGADAPVPAAALRRLAGADDPILTRDQAQAVVDAAPADVQALVTARREARPDES